MRSRKDLLEFSAIGCGTVILAAALTGIPDVERATAGKTTNAVKGTPMLDMDTESVMSEPEDVNRFDGKPYKLYPDGKVDFATYRGMNLYANLCHACHGQASLGSSFGPSLVDALQYLSYSDFVNVVMRGRENITPTSKKVMPSFGDNKTVVKYIDSLYAYLKGRSDGALPAADLDWKGPKNQ